MLSIADKKLIIPSRGAIVFPTELDSIYQVCATNGWLILDKDGNVFYYNSSLTGENLNLNLNFQPSFHPNCQKINLGKYKVDKISVYESNVIFLVTSPPDKNQYLLINQATYDSCVEINSCATLLWYFKNPAASWYIPSLRLYNLPLPLNPSGQGTIATIDQTTVPISASYDRSKCIENIKVAEKFIKLRYNQPNTRSISWHIDIWYCGQLPSLAEDDDGLNIRRIHNRFEELGQTRWLTPLPLWRGRKYGYCYQD